MSKFVDDVLALIREGQCSPFIGAGACAVSLCSATGIRT